LSRKLATKTQKVPLFSTNGAQKRLFFTYFDKRNFFTLRGYSQRRTRRAFQERKNIKGLPHFTADLSVLLRKFNG
jgi:hypothetical protein